MAHNVDGFMPTDASQSLRLRATVGIITALATEFVAVKAMLDSSETYTDEGSGAGRRYLVGEVHTQDGATRVIALAMLTEMGNNSASTRTTQLLVHFPNVKHIIMCGIAGGIPNPGNTDSDVRLGDIVISNRMGVIKYDFVRRSKNGRVEPRFSPRSPDAQLLEAVEFLRVTELERQRPWEEFFSRGAHIEDVDRPADNLNADGSTLELVRDAKRRPGFPRVFRGPIASADTLLKDTKLRDVLRDKYHVKAVEMESSGVADAAWISGRAGYLTVRGICDYCDDKKGDLWQGYAALAAACYVRALLESMPRDVSDADISTRTPRRARSEGVARKSKEWPSTLSFERAQRNCETDILGDWYRDPWAWSEIRWALAKGKRFIQSRLNSSGSRAGLPLDVLKENFGVRPATILDPLDRLIYQALVDQLSVELTDGLAPHVFGWRLPRDVTIRGKYARQDFQWSNFISRLSRLSRERNCALKTDVSSFFSSIPIERIAVEITRRTSSPAVADRLIEMLRDWDKADDRPGLPQRSMASAVLANMYLMPVDDCIANHARQQRDSRAVARWMDDIWLFGDEPNKLRRAQIETQQRLRELRLEMNLAKTDVLEGDRLREEAARLQRGAIDYGLSLSPPNLLPLNKLLDEILSEPARASRTSVRFATTRMRSSSLWARVPDFVACADRMPHASDILARLFHESDAWRDMGSWFIDYCKTTHSYSEWSAAQFGTMFPADQLPTQEVIDHFAEVLASGASLPMMALTAHRLARWDSDTAIAAVREASRKADHPLMRRVLAFASVTASPGSASVRKLLTDFEENQLLLAMFEDFGFQPVRATRDFSSDDVSA